MWFCVPVKGALMEEWTPEPPAPQGTLEVCDFKKLKVETLGHGVNSFSLSADRKQVLLFVIKKLRVLKAGEKVEERRRQVARGRLDRSAMAESTDRAGG